MDKILWEIRNHPDCSGDERCFRFITQGPDAFRLELLTKFSVHALEFPKDVAVVLAKRILAEATSAMADGGGAHETGGDD